MSIMNRLIFIIVLFSGLLFSLALFAPAHPFKASVCEILYNPETERLEITLKLFTDDLEECVREGDGTLLFLETGKEIPSAGRAIDDYIQSGMRISVAGRDVELEYLGKEHDPGLTWCYLESEKVAYPFELTVYSSIMTEMYSTQSNIVHIQAGKERKSLLLGRGRVSGTVRFGQ